MNDELLDLVDENDEVIGTISRKAAHQDSKSIHREIAIAVYNDLGEVLLQQRSIHKTSPGAWKITAAGHVTAGEHPDHVCKREVVEELGLFVEPVFFEKFLDQMERESRFYWLYYAVVKGHPKLTLQESEVMAAEWVKLEELEDFSKMHDYQLTGVSHEYIMKMAPYAGIKPDSIAI